MLDLEISNNKNKFRLGTTKFWDFKPSIAKGRRDWLVFSNQALRTRGFK